MAGLAEYGRPGIMVSPQFGTNFRTVMLTVTDLPLAVTKPIDAGITNFCRTCQKCAEMCPSGAISTEKETQWADWADGEQPWQAKGIKGWYIDAKKCYGYMLGNEPDCNMCQAVCPFSKFDSAVMHDLVRMSISSTPALNKIIRTLDDTFGYGQERGVDMWDVDPMDIPLWGLDTSRS
jgi:reductive dehalogenase